MYQWDRRYGILERYQNDINDIADTIYTYLWYNHQLMVNRQRKKMRIYKYRDDEIDKNFINIFYHYYGI